MTAYLYSIINKINGHRYVGKTFNMEHRKEQHLNALEKGNHHAHKLQRAYNKYGQKNFYWEICPVEINSEEELSLKEIQAIEKYDSYYNGYNETLGGDGNKLKFNLDFTIALAHVLANYSGICTKIAKYYNCDKSTIAGIRDNKTYRELVPNKNIVNKIIQEVGLSDSNLNENYIQHNQKKLDQEKCFEILSICLTEQSYDRTLCDIFGINSKVIYRLKRNQIYKNFFKAFMELPEDEKNAIKELVMKKYDLAHVSASRKRSGVKNALTQEQINYILDNKDKKTRVQIGQELQISSDRISSVILGKSYKDLANNYYSSRNDCRV